MDLELKGKRALVTGSSRGLGFAVARCLIQEGARVAMNSRSEKSIQASAENLQDEYHAELLALPGDMADPRVPDRIIAQLVERFGGLDILITNAGGPPPVHLTLWLSSQTLQFSWYPLPLPISPELCYRWTAVLSRVPSKEFHC
jgi:3-oxoacyl-[acyl-carrier protein] reductase